MSTLEEKLTAIYKKWLRCWMKEEKDPLWLRDALRAAAQLGADEAYEDAAKVADDSYEFHHDLHELAVADALRIVRNKLRARRAARSGEG